MTAHNSQQYASRGSVSAAVDPLAPNVSGGRIRQKYAKLAASAQTLAQNDTINLFRLPKGAKPLFYMSKHGAFGASVTMSLGTSGSASLYENAVSISAAGGQFLALDDTAIITTDGGIVIQALLEGANPADDKDLEVWFFYTLD